MIQQEIIRKIAELIMQNAENTNSIGLYDGKAGLSLSLFIAAGYLQNEYIEDVAYKLFQESLIRKNNEISFESGLAGIGYVMLYLLENKYLEADFDEIFGIQCESIIRYFENIEKVPARLIDSFQTVYFLSMLSNIKKEDDRISKIIKKFFEGMELFLAIQFQDFTDILYIKNKSDVLNKYEIYLKLVDYSGYTDFSRYLLEDYASLYRKRKIISSLEIGFYLSKITANYTIDKYEDIINENINNGISNIYPNTLSLKERIDYAKIINELKREKINEFDLIQENKNMYEDKAIHDLLKIVDERSFPFGYGAGLGRLLVYCVNNNAELL